MEAAAARLWYGERSRNISESFVEELDRAIGLIRSTPGRWPKFVGGTRRILMRRFPLSVVYLIEQDTAIVVAVAHGRRRPGYWRARRAGRDPHRQYFDPFAGMLSGKGKATKALLEERKREREHEDIRAR